MNNVVIVNGLRSPFVKRNKHFKDISAIQLGGQVISGICKQSKVNPEALYMGCVYEHILKHPLLDLPLFHLCFHYLLLSIHLFLMGFRVRILSFYLQIQES